MIEGLTAYTAPAGSVQKGRFMMPPEFPKHLVGKWVKQGPSVTMARQPVPIPSEGVVASGWETWLDKQKKPCVRTVASGAFILMFRPRVLQTAINKIHGNQSRKRMIDEAQGKTVTSVDGGQVSDRGVLTRDVLNQIPGLRENDQAFEGSVQLNDLTPEPTAPVQAEVHQPEQIQTKPNRNANWKIK